MRTFLRMFGNAMVLALVACATAVSPDQAASAAKAFLKRVDSSIDAAELSRILITDVRPETTVRLGQNSTLWRVSTAWRDLTVDDQGQVTSYTDALFFKRRPNPYWSGPRLKAFFTSETDWTNQAWKILKQIGWTHGQQSYLDEYLPPDSKGEGYDSIVYVEFSDMPRDGRPRLERSVVSVGLDFWTGKPVILDRNFALSREFGAKTVEKEEAIAIAKTITRVADQPRVAGPSFTLPDGQWRSARAERLLRANTAPQTYRVVGDDELVTVAADTGEVLVRTRIYGHDDSGGKVMTALLVVVGAGVAILLWIRGSISDKS